MVAGSVEARVVDGGTFGEDLERLRQTLAGGEPPELRAGYLVEARPDSMFVLGTGVPVVGRMVEHRSGLLVPEGATRRPEPLDLMQVYIIATDVFGSDPGMEFVTRT